MGSSNELGDWGSNNNPGLILNFKEGYIWSGKIPFKENFEFKFVFFHENGSFNKWESGENRTFNFNEIKKKIEEEETDRDGKIIFSDDCTMYEYDQKQEKIKIKCNWRN